MTQYATEAVGQVGRTAGKGLAVVLSVLPTLLIIVGVICIIPAVKVIPASQATSLSLFSGKAATAADTAIIGTAGHPGIVTTCGKATNTLLAVAWIAPPLRVTGDTLGAAASKPGAVTSLSSCIAGKLVAAGPSAQACPADAQSSAGSSITGIRAYVVRLVACLTSLGAS